MMSVSLLTGRLALIPIVSRPTECCLPGGLGPKPRQFQLGLLIGTSLHYPGFGLSWALSKLFPWVFSPYVHNWSLGVDYDYSHFMKEEIEIQGCYINGSQSYSL